MKEDLLRRTKSSGPAPLPTEGIPNDGSTRLMPEVISDDQMASVTGGSSVGYEKDFRQSYSE